MKYYIFGTEEEAFTAKEIIDSYLFTVSRGRTSNEDGSEIISSWKMPETDGINWFLEYPDIMGWSGDFLPDLQIVTKKL